MIDLWIEKLMQMSLIGTYSILIIAAARLLLKRVKRKYVY